MQLTEKIHTGFSHLLTDTTTLTTETAENIRRKTIQLTGSVGRCPPLKPPEIISSHIPGQLQQRITSAITAKYMIERILHMNM